MADDLSFGHKRREEKINVCAFLLIVRLFKLCWVANGSG